MKIMDGEWVHHPIQSALGRICEPRRCTCKIHLRSIQQQQQLGFPIGKPSLEALNTVHDYGNDTVFITGIGGSTTMQNQVQHPHYAHIGKTVGVNLALDIKQYQPGWLMYEMKTQETTNKTNTKTNIVDSTNGGKKKQHKSKSVRHV